MKISPAQVLTAYRSLGFEPSATDTPALRGGAGWRIWRCGPVDALWLEAHPGEFEQFKAQFAAHADAQWDYLRSAEWLRSLHGQSYGNGFCTYSQDPYSKGDFYIAYMSGAYRDTAVEVEEWLEGKLDGLAVAAAIWPGDPQFNRNEAWRQLRRQMEMRQFPQAYYTALGLRRYIDRTNHYPKLAEKHKVEGMLRVVLELHKPKEVTDGTAQGPGT